MCAILNGIAAHAHLPAERRDVPRLRRLLRARRSGSRRSATSRSSTSSRTTASASARTGRRTSRSRRSPACASSPTSTSSARPTRRRPRARSSPRSTAPTGRRSSRSRGRTSRCSPRSRSRRAARGRSRGATSRRRRRRRSTSSSCRPGASCSTRSRPPRRLGAGTRVVSLPCFARFDRQPDAYREEVLPQSCRKRLAIEATVSSTWAKYVGLDGVDPRHRPLRHLGARRRGDEAPRDDRRARPRGREEAALARKARLSVGRGRPRFRRRRPHDPS